VRTIMVLQPTGHAELAVSAHETRQACVCTVLVRSIMVLQSTGHAELAVSAHEKRQACVCTVLVRRGDCENNYGTAAYRSRRAGCICT
jgi:hypothetical protein